MRSYLTAAVLSLIFTSVVPAADWRPVDASLLAQKTPKVEPGADAEAIFWDVRIEDRLMGQDISLAMNHYLRIKIFTDLGKEKYATVEIPQYGKRRIDNVAGRTIKPDGTIIELKKDSIFDRDLVKTKGGKLHGKTFTLPNVQTGDIIEYQYKETRDDELASYMRLQFQRDIPVWDVSYHLKPLNVPWLPWGMRSMAFACNHPPIVKESNGFYGLTLTNMPAFKEEAYMPPEDQLRAWILIYYEEDKKIVPEKYWKELGKSDFAKFKPLISADSQVKRTAAEVTTGFTRDEDKLMALDVFCRAKIKNLSRQASQMTPAELKAVKENHSPGDTLKQKAGWGMDVDRLFAAMANAVGFDARLARIPDRADTFFSPARPTTYFMNSISVAVEVGGKWVFFDPSTPYLDSGMLRWQEEGQQALVSDPKEGFFVQTQFSQPQRSMRQRRATFKLLEDGTLEGDVTYTYTGHSGVGQKATYENMTPAQQEEDWKKSLQQRLSTAEMSDFSMKYANDPLHPLTVSHKVAVPAYATRTGKRILLQPAFFQRNVGPRFTETTRKWDIYFDYGWMEDDEVTIELPAGWELDQPLKPSNAKLADVGAYDVQVLKTTDGRKLIYRRKMEWGRDNKLLLPAGAYASLKKIFDFVQEQDNYTIALKAAPDAQ